MTAWDVITNPVTGETITFLERTPERLTFDLEIPPGGPGILAHQHAWIEHVTVRRGGWTSPSPVPCTASDPATSCRWATWYTGR